MPMIPEVKKLWIENLRNPDLVQGHGILRDSKGRQCCLDVLNQQCSDAGCQPQPVLVDNSEIYGYADPSAKSDILEDGYQVTVLTEAAMAYAGIGQNDPEVRYRDGLFRLTYLNDEGLTGEGPLSLPEIADVIEADEGL